MDWLLWAQEIPKLAGERNDLLLYGGGAAGVVFLVFVVVLLTRRKKAVDPEAGLGEDVSKLPPAPEAGSYSLKVMGQPGRLRLVVLAPVGKKELGDPGQVLEQVVGNLGEVALDDQPRVKVWPPQLSKQGFAPTFHRLVTGAGPRWVLLAGPARSGGVPVLLGLAVELERPAKMGTLTLDEHQWAEVVRVEE